MSCVPRTYRYDSVREGLCQPPFLQSRPFRLALPQQLRGEVKPQDIAKAQQLKVGDDAPVVFHAADHLLVKTDVFFLHFARKLGL